ncbi:hypothetical protein MJO29_007574, partial [Puccinia striiformis f. sp. tritici]
IIIDPHSPLSPGARPIKVRGYFDTTGKLTKRSGLRSQVHACLTELQLWIPKVHQSLQVFGPEGSCFSQSAFALLGSTALYCLWDALIRLR